MRFYFILLALFLAVSLGGQDFQNYLVPTTRTTKDGTTILEAPTFPTLSYVRTHFLSTRPTTPAVELAAPARLADFVVDGHLELSLKAYLELVLANNTDIQIAKLSVEQPKNAITRALAAFDPSMVASFGSTRTKRPSTSATEGSAAISSSLNQPLRLTYTQTLDTGTAYNVGFSGTKSASNSNLSNFNPSISSSLNLSITQPLLRNRGRGINRINVVMAESRYKISRNNLVETLLRLVSNAETIYWQVVDARENLGVSQQALDLAQKTLERNEQELKLGAIPELDIYQPQQNVAQREISVEQAKTNLEQAYDNLRRQIGADLDPDYRHMSITLTEPVNPPEEEPTIDAEQMVDIAYQRRPDMQTQQENLYLDDLNYKSAANGLRPDLSLSMNYSSNGTGGNIYEYSGSGFNRVLVNTIPGGLTDSLNQLFGFDYPSYGVTLSLRFPIRDRGAIANMADAVVSKKLNALQARTTQQQIRLDVLNAVANVESSKARVKLSRTALEFSEKRLDGEKQKYDLGVSDIFFLLDAQNALSAAQADLVTQAAAYRRSITNLLRVTGQLLDERGIVVP